MSGGIVLKTFTQTAQDLNELSPHTHYGNSVEPLSREENEKHVATKGAPSCDRGGGPVQCQGQTVSSKVPNDKEYNNGAFESDANDNINSKIENSTDSVSVELDSDSDDVFESLPPPTGGLSSALYSVTSTVTSAIQQRWPLIKWCIIAAILIGYFVYFGFALAYEFGSEPSVRLLWVTCLVVLCIGLYIVYCFFQEDFEQFGEACATERGKRVIAVTLWVVLLAIYLAVVTVLLVDVFFLTQEPYNLVSLCGLLLLLAFCFVFSYSPANVNWRAVLWGIALQFIFALIILRTPWGYVAFQWLGDRVSEFLAHADAGAEFVFGPDFRDHFIAFVVLPVVIFFSTVISILYYLGVMQVVVRIVGWVLQSLLGTTAGESLNAAGNIFIGQSEAPLMIRPLLRKMTRSEIHAVMTGGFATIAGSVMAGYILFGVPANHLISASVMSAPAALAISKLFYPETQVSKTTADDVKSMEKSNFTFSKDRNLLAAASSGAFQSIILVASIAVNLIAFVSLLHFLNSTLTWFGHRVGWDDPPLTFELICSYLLYPLAVVMGASLENCRIVAELVGVKTFINEFVAYERLGVFINNRMHYNDHESVNGSYGYQGDDLVLYNYTDTTSPEPKFYEAFVLDRGILTDRTEVISTYALCGFANFGSVGIVLGTLSAMAPTRKADIAQVALRAMLAGNIACFTTACIAGLFYSGPPQD